MAKAAKPLKAKTDERKVDAPPLAAFGIDGKRFSGPGAEYEWHMDARRPLEPGCMVAVMHKEGEVWLCYGIGRIASDKFPDVRDFNVKFEQCHVRGAPKGMRFGMEGWHADSQLWYDDLGCLARVVRQMRDLV